MSYGSFAQVGVGDLSVNVYKKKHFLSGFPLFMNLSWSHMIISRMTSLKVFTVLFDLLSDKDEAQL